MLRLCRNHSAFNSHNFPRTCTTTYLFSMLPCHSNRHAPTRDACRFGTYLVASGCTYGLFTVSFHSFCIEVSFDAVSAQSFARPLAGLLATHLAIVYSVYSAYLPGLHSARPSAFVEGGGVEPPAHPKLFGDSPPRGRTAVAFFGRCARLKPFPLFQSCRFAPLFRLFLPLFFVSLWHSNPHPDRLLLVKSHHSASQFRDFARCNHSLYLVFWVS